jgi:hypothetical protein
MARRAWIRAQDQLRMPVPAKTVVSARDPSRPNVAGYSSGRPPQWQDYDGVYVGRLAAQFSYAYIGYRTDSAGVSRIVVVTFQVGEDAASGSKPDRWQVNLTGQSFVPVTWWSEPQANPAGTRWTQITLPVMETKYTLFAGQPEPADASRFTIECDGGNGLWVVDGQLLPDGKVTLAVRPSAATRPGR